MKIFKVLIFLSLATPAYTAEMYQKPDEGDLEYLSLKYLSENYVDVELSPEEYEALGKEIFLTSQAPLTTVSSSAPKQVKAAAKPAKEQKQGQQKKYICKICERKFTRLSSLKRHIDMTHEGKTPFKCKHCRFSSGYKHSVAKHEKRHEKRPQQAPDVVEFVDKSEKSPLGEFVCEARDDGYGFATKYGLEKHRKTMNH